MTVENEPKGTRVTDRGTVTIPSDIRRSLDIEPGDKRRWATDEDGALSVEVVQQHGGVFDDFEPVDAGETNAVEAEAEFGAEW